MRSIIIIIFSVCCMSNVQAQLYEAGIFVGGSNFIGDVGSSVYISPNKPAAGLLFKWNRSPRHSLRASVLFTKLEGSDRDSRDSRRRARNYGFKNSIFEFSTGMEFTFLEFDLYSTEPQFTPYLYTGITMARYKNQFFVPTTPPSDNGLIYPISENTYSWTLGIPMTVGLKGTLSHKFIIGAEIGVRYTFSDKIDGSVPDDKSRREQYSFGNINSNDWYVFSGITLTYTFGQKPCYCYY